MLVSLSYFGNRSCTCGLHSILDGSKKRFQLNIKSMNCLFVAAFHCHFKFLRVPLLPSLECEDVASQGIELHHKIKHVINSNIETDVLSQCRKS